MSLELALRCVEERNSSRNLAPAARPVGLRLQVCGTVIAVGVVALATLEGSPAPTGLMAETR